MKKSIIPQIIAFWLSTALSASIVTSAFAAESFERAFRRLPAATPTQLKGKIGKWVLYETRSPDGRKAAGLVWDQFIRIAPNQVLYHQPIGQNQSFDVKDPLEIREGEFSIDVGPHPDVQNMIADGLFCKFRPVREYRPVQDEMICRRRWQVEIQTSLPQQPSTSHWEGGELVTDEAPDPGYETSYPEYENYEIYRSVDER